MLVFIGTLVLIGLMCAVCGGMLAYRNKKLRMALEVLRRLNHENIERSLVENKKR